MAIKTSELLLLEVRNEGDEYGKGEGEESKTKEGVKEVKN